MAKGRSIIGNPKWCSICGLVIPDCIVTSTHPLYGTIDHVIPLSKGGRNILANRRPAHRWCNNHKGSRIRRLSEVMLLSFQAQILIWLRKFAAKRYCTEKAVQEARIRIGMEAKGTNQQRREAADRYFHRWCDDGGFCLDLPEDSE